MTLDARRGVVIRAVWCGIGGGRSPNWVGTWAGAGGTAGMAAEIAAATVSEMSSGTAGAAPPGIAA